MFDPPLESPGLFQQFHALVAQIPYGKVATYGQIARMAGHPRAARMVGWALHDSPADLPCHRVVNREGGTAPGWPEQRTLLEAEGITLNPDGRVDLAVYLWDGSCFEGSEPRD
ncbi:MAG: MGMT family protein [Bacillota bacterium]